MSVTEDRPRPDLSALRIHREDDDAHRVSWGKIIGWIIALGIVIGAAIAIYTVWIVPRRAPVGGTGKGVGPLPHPGTGPKRTIFSGPVGADAPGLVTGVYAVKS